MYDALKIISGFPNITLHISSVSDEVLLLTETITVLWLAIMYSLPPHTIHTCSNAYRRVRLLSARYLLSTYIFIVTNHG